MNGVNGPPITLAVDPGGVTGMAWVVDGRASGGTRVVAAGEVEGGRFGFYDAFERYVETGVNIVAIVCEDFLVTAATAKKTQQPDAMRVIGYLEAWARKHGVEFHLQTPSTAKTFATNAKLKHLGWYQSTKGGHRNDALRHLLVYLAIRKGDIELRHRLQEMEA